MPRRAAPTRAILWAAAAAAAHALSRAPQATVNVGVIGCGRIGRVHLSTLSSVPFLRVRRVCDYFEDCARQAAEDFGVAEFTTSAEDVICDPEVDAVWICSPSQFHFEQIRQCAENGKHVFCEKPLATELQDCLSAVSICKERGVKLMTALQRRFDPNFARLREGIASGEVGHPVSLKLTSRDPSPPPVEYVRGGGGIFADMAVHDLDMSRFLFGEEPVAVFATGATLVDARLRELPGAEQFDTAHVLVKYPGDKIASIDVCRQAPYGYDQRAEFLGTEGILRLDNVYPSTVKKANSQFTGNADLPHDFFMTRYAEAYRQETLAFAAALRDGHRTPCDGFDGVVATAMALAATRSSLEGRWVTIEEVLGHPLVAAGAAERSVRHVLLREGSAAEENRDAPL